MAALRKLTLLSLWGIAYSQVTNTFVEFLAPQKSEVVTVGIEYVIKWVPESPIGSGTMSLLTGQTSESLTKIREIAYLADVTNGSFSWPVAPPALAQSSSFYAFNLSLDGSESTFAISPLFKISFETIPGSNGTCDDNLAGQTTNAHRNQNQSRRAIRPTTMLTSRKQVFNKSTNQNQGTPVFDMSSFATSYMAVVEKSPISSNNDKDAADNTSSKRFNPRNNVIINSNSGFSTSGLTSDSNSGSQLSNGAIAGIVIGASTAVAIFSSLIWLVFYYRRKLLEKVRFCVKETCGPEKPSPKESCRPNAVATTCSQTETAKMYELNATREPQEADGKMKPAELGLTVPRLGPLAADMQHGVIYTQLE
ncbi:hypothetical protein GQX73_g9893 [Xylaria multiplex]|uniref:Yeast cell wall synthesis Kre9/Knh1-like N-terminal domain-containing protein n=1 Tax=Xylaria multiplex TaxID=323545 RepID=A0A7C8MMC3_9PEZI|nr:hypothetical protein GQX73_g9893 [Xylaria multiplex]